MQGHRGTPIVDGHMPVMQHWPCRGTVAPQQSMVTCPGMQHWPCRALRPATHRRVAWRVRAACGAWQPSPGASSHWALLPPLPPPLLPLLLPLMLVLALLLQPLAPSQPPCSKPLRPPPLLLHAQHLRLPPPRPPPPRPPLRRTAPCCQPGARCQARWVAAALHAAPCAERRAPRRSAPLRGGGERGCGLSGRACQGGGQDMSGRGAAGGEGWGGLRLQHGHHSHCPLVCLHPQGPLRCRQQQPPCLHAASSWQQQLGFSQFWGEHGRQRNTPSPS